MPKETTDLPCLQADPTLTTEHKRSTVALICRQHVRVSAAVLQTVWPTLSALEIRVHAALILRVDGWRERGLAPPRLRADKLSVFVRGSVRRVQMAVNALVKKKLIRIVGKLTDPRGAEVELLTIDIAVLSAIPPSSDPKRSELPPPTPIQTDRSSAPDTLLVSILDRRSTLTDQRAHACAPSRARTRDASGPVGRSVVATLAEVFGAERWGDGVYLGRCVDRLRDGRSVTDDEIVSFARARAKLDFVQRAKMPPAVALNAEAFDRWRARRAKAPSAPAPSPASPTQVDTAQLASRAASLLASLKRHE